MIGQNELLVVQNDASFFYILRDILRDIFRDILRACSRAFRSQKNFVRMRKRRGLCFPANDLKVEI